jgi:anti-sigma B factor antagonist
MLEAGRPEIRFEKQGRITIGAVHTPDMLDDSNVSQFADRLMKYISANPGIHLLLDFESVEYLSSAVLSELLRANGACRNNSGSLRICGLSPQIYQVFQITSLDKLFAIQANEKCEAARNRFERALRVADDEQGWASVTGKIE